MSAKHPSVPQPPTPHVRRDGGPRAEAVGRTVGSDQAGPVEREQPQQAAGAANATTHRSAEVADPNVPATTVTTADTTADSAAPATTAAAITATAAAVGAAQGEGPVGSTSPHGASITPVPSTETAAPGRVQDASAAAVLSTMTNRQQRLVSVGESAARLADSPALTELDGAAGAAKTGASTTAGSTADGATITVPSTAAPQPGASIPNTATSANTSTSVGPTTNGATINGPATTATTTQPIAAETVATPDVRLTTSVAGTPVPVPLSAGPVSAAPAATPAPFVAPAIVSAQLGPQALAAAAAATKNGLHTISVQLRPAQLGSVQVVATMGPSGLSLSLHAATDATREVLRAAMADLQSDLASSGLKDVSIQVSDQAPDQSTGQSAGQPDGQQSNLRAGLDGASAHRGAGGRADLAGDPSSELAQPARPHPGSGRRLDLRV